MTWSINMSGHDDGPASCSAWFSSSKTPNGHGASFTGVLEEVAEKAVAFIRQSQEEEAADAAAEVPAEAESAPASEDAPESVPSAEDAPAPPEDA